MRILFAAALLLIAPVGGAVANWYGGGPLFAHPIEVHQPPPGVQAFWQGLFDNAG